jgi:hypothetical protein
MKSHARVEISKQGEEPFFRFPVSGGDDNGRKFAFDRGTTGMIRISGFLKDGKSRRRG